MPEITLLQPRVLLGVIERLEFPDTFLGLSLMGTPEPNPWPVAEWDVIASNKQIAAPNVPNVEAKIVPHLGVARRTASLIYLREKKLFKTTTLHWLRQPGTVANKRNAEQAVMREIEDLDRRFNAFAEFTIWSMLRGILTLNYYDVKATVDYLIQATHKATVVTPWSTHATADVIGDVWAWRRMISTDGAGAAASIAVVNSKTMRDIALNAKIQTFFSDRLKEQYLSTGSVSGLLQLDWRIYDATFVDSAGATKLYVEDDDVHILATGPARPYYMLEGPSADFEAPDDHIGKFAKSWIEPDPSARQYLEEWHFLPVLERPDQVVYADVS